MNIAKKTFPHKNIMYLYSSTYSSMVSNGLYHHKEDGAVTSGTHISSHSQISDYETLGERDYEVIDCSNKHDYQHLQRPSFPNNNGGRNATFNGGLSSAKELQSMSTLASQRLGTVGGAGGGAGGPPPSLPHNHRGLRNWTGTIPVRSSSEGPPPLESESATEAAGHVYRTLDPGPPSAHRQHQHQHHQRAPANPNTRPVVMDIYRSPTATSDSPDNAHPSFFRTGMSTIGGGTGEFQQLVGGEEDAMYSPNPDDIQLHIQSGGLENMPETGRFFPEPQNPTAFPVHKYEQIAGSSGQYEIPLTLAERTKRSATAATTISTSPMTGQQVGNAGPSNETRSRTTTANSDQPLVGSVEGHEIHPRTNSGRYETEMLPAAAAKTTSAASTQYHKLARLTSDRSLTLLSEKRGLNYSELGAASLSDENDSTSSKKSLVEARNETAPPPGGVPYHMHASNPAATGGRQSGYSSASSASEMNIVDATMTTNATLMGDNGLQSDSVFKTDHQAESYTQYDQQYLHHCGRNGSLDETTAQARDFPVMHQTRAKSEERRDAMMVPQSSRHAYPLYSSEEYEDHHQGSQTVGSRSIIRELRTNGLDPRVGEYVRSKTMV